MAVRSRKGLILSFGAFALLAAGIFFWLQSKAPAVSEREYATQVLAELLTAAAKPKAVLVIGNPFADLPNRPSQVYEFEKAGVAGLKRGFGSEIPLKIGHPRVNPSVLANPGSVQIDPKSSTPLSFIIESTAFDELFKANPECDLAVSLIGLPVSLGSMEAWTKAGSPRFGLLLPDWRMVGDTQAIEKAFASGKLAGAVVVRPEGANAPDLKERYVLISSNNVAQLLRTSPQLFGF